MPVFIEELILKDWRTYRGRTRIAFHPYSGMSAVLGENGSGKTSLLDAIAFVTYARGLRKRDIQNSSHDSSVTLKLTDGSHFRRCGDGVGWYNHELVSESVYQNAVRSKISTYYYAQLSNSREFFEPCSLSRFIECEQLVNVTVPPLMSTEEFASLNNDVRVEFLSWKVARKGYLDASTDIATANKDLSGLKMSQKHRNHVSRLERRIHLLRQLQIKHAIKELNSKIDCLAQGIQSLETRTATYADKVALEERNLQTLEQRMEELQERFKTSKKTIDQTNRRIIATSISIYSIAEDEVTLIQDQERNQQIMLAIEPLYEEKLSEVDNELSRLMKSNQDCETCELDIYVEERSEKPRTYGEKLLSAANKCAQIIRNTQILVYEARIHAAKKAQERYVAMIELHKTTKHELMMQLRTTDSKLKTADFGSSYLRNNNFTETNGQSNREDSLQHLKQIDGVLGILHELVRPQRGYENALWSVMGEEANLLLVKDEVSFLKCTEFLRSTPLTLVSGIIDVSVFENVVAPDQNIFREVKLLCPEAIFLGTMLEVDDTPYKDMIRRLASQNAIIVPDVYKYIENHRGYVPECTYCDPQGFTRTARGVIKKFSVCLSYIATGDSNVVGRPDRVSIGLLSDDEDLHYEENEANFKAAPNNETEFQKMECIWLSKRIKVLDGRITRLQRLAYEQSRDEYRARLALSACNDGTADLNVAGIVECIKAIVGIKVDENSQLHMLQTLGLAEELKSELSIVDSLRQKTAEALELNRKKAVDLAIFKGSEETLLRKLNEQRSGSLEQLEPLLNEYGQAKKQFEQTSNDLSENRRCKLQLEEEELEPAKQVKSLLVEDSYYIDLAKRAIADKTDAAYNGIDDRTRHREETDVRAESSQTDPETLIQKYQEELTKEPVLLFHTGQRGVEEMKELVDQYKAVQARADEAQVDAIRRLDRASQRLEEAKKTRNERLMANIGELTRRAASTYQTVVVGRQAAPRIQRVFLAPLDDANPWKGVMCTCHPVGRQNTPVVQLSNSEMQIVELCIKMSALAGDGTKLVLYDEVDSGLDSLTCNALGNFIRKRSGSPGGGQAIIATHKRPTYNTAHNLIGVYRVDIGDDELGSSEGSERQATNQNVSNTSTKRIPEKPAKKRTVEKGASMVVTHMRRLDGENRFVREPARPRNPEVGLYAN